MKVCIVTVYNSINSGSFWQARALGIVLNSLGIEVVYLRRKNTFFSTSSKIYQLMIIMNALLKKGIRKTEKVTKIYKEFAECQKVFKVIPNKKIYFNDIDLFILGSDTIWNLDSKFFDKNYKTFFGGDFKGKDVISYAASIANTSLDKIKKYKDIPEMLNNMKGISVRDEKTYKMVDELSNNDVKIVCDPTMLLRKEDYKNIEKTPIERDKYVLLYLFQSLTEEQIRNIKEFASKKKLKIINIVNDVNWSNKNILNTPNNFLNYMLYADYIITDTFHGSIFSINLNKQVVIIDRNKNKVNEFVKNIGLKEKLINDNNISDNLEKIIDYSFINSKLEEFRYKSLNFLREQINKEGK